VIIDGTEIPIKVPKPPAAQQVTFWTYKNRNTAKILVGVTPGGLALVNFVSDAYGGSASDRQIIEKSMLTEKLELGDSAMTDKGFDVLNFNVLNVLILTDFNSICTSRQKGAWHCKQRA